ncbi:MAG TPA: hypothetical protein VGE93_06590 [Bryobacteraceae bacterium]
MHPLWPSQLARRSAGLFWVIGLLAPGFAFAQQVPAKADSAPGAMPVGKNPPEPQRKRIFGIIPNYRTFPSLVHYEPLTPGQKFKISAQDSFDRGTFVLAAAFAGESQLTNANPSFGDGVAAYGRYLGTAYADFVIGDMMTEGLYPTLLRQDPRYFRRGTGSGMARIGYAVGQLFWTHTDSGAMQFNYAEVVGNSTAVAISTAYYADNRNASDALIKLATQLGVDGAANILKEFSPDIYRKFHRKHLSATN